MIFDHGRRSGKGHYPRTSRTSPYRGAPHSAHDGLVAELYLSLDQLDVLAEHTVPLSGEGRVLVWCVEEVWPIDESGGAT